MPGNQKSYIPYPEQKIMAVTKQEKLNHLKKKLLRLKIYKITLTFLYTS